MNPQQVTLIVFIKAKPSTKRQVKDALLDLTKKTRAESGCINYDLHVARDDDSLFIIHENWKDQAAHDSHMNQPHLKSFLASADALLDQPIDATFCTKS